MPNLNPSDFPDTVFSTGTRIELQRLGIYDATAYIEQGGTVQDAINDCPEGGTVLLRRQTYDCPAGLTMTNKPVNIVGQGTQSILQTNQAVTLLNVNAATTSMVGWGIRDCQLRGLNVGTVGIGVNRSAAWEHTQFNITNVLVNGFAIGMDVESPSKGMLINTALEFGFGVSTGLKCRGGFLQLLNCWFEQVAKALDLYGSTDIIGVGTKFAANVTTRLTILSESGYVPRYNENGNDGWVPLVYGPTIATDGSLGKYFSFAANNGTAFTISNPTNPIPGKEISYDILNSSGGAMGVITWGAAFKLAGAFTNPANTKRRTISFYYDGTNWVETTRTAADI